MADEKKGITVKIDADLHAEIREYLERHEGMTIPCPQSPRTRQSIRCRCKAAVG